MAGSKKIVTIFLFLVVCAAFYIYNPGQFYFLNDDFVHIPLSSQGHLLQHGFFRPLCDLSVMLDYRIWGTQAWGYHFTNLLLHIINSAGCFFLCRLVLKRYGLPGDVTKMSAVIAVLFFIYAMHSESVFWILGRSAALGCLFFIPALFFYLKRENNFPAFILSVLFMGLSWSSYESTWILPVIILIFSVVDVKTGKYSVKKEFFYTAIVFLMFGAYLGIRYSFTGEFLSDYSAVSFINLDIPVLALKYFKMLVRSWLPPVQNASLLVLLFVILGTVIAYFLYSTYSEKNRRNTFLLAVALLMWLVSLVPVTSLGIDTKGSESERFLYLPSLFVCFMWGLLICRIERNALREAAVVLLMLYHLVFLFRSMKHYRYAGEVTRTAVNEITRLKGPGVLYVSNLPEECHGALIFRSGFLEAVRWRGPEEIADSVKILSMWSDDQQFIGGYRSMPIDSAGIAELMKYDKIFLSRFRFDRDACFIFRDSSLLVFKGGR